MQRKLIVATVAGAILAVAGAAQADLWHYDVGHRITGEWWGGDAGNPVNPTTQAEGWTTGGSGTAGWSRGVVTVYGAGKALAVTWSYWVTGSTDYTTTPATPWPGYQRISNMATTPWVKYRYAVDPVGSDRDVWFNDIGNVWRAQRAGAGTWSLTTTLGGGAGGGVYAGLQTAEVVIDITTQTANLYVNGTPEVTGVAVDTEAAIRAMNSFYFQHKGASSSNSYTVSFEVETIPEPITLGLAALGGLGILIRRKRR